MIAVERNRSVTGVMMLLAAVTMFFAAFTSAMVVRRGLSADWLTTPLPPVVWANTGVLAASSVALYYHAMKWTKALGMVFLAGQLEVWRELMAAGIYLPSNPSASFFYILTAAHFAHLAGGLIALHFANRQAALLYWHFMTGLWIYVLLLFALWG